MVPESSSACGAQLYSDGPGTGLAIVSSAVSAKAARRGTNRVAQRIR